MNKNNEVPLTATERKLLSYEHFITEFIDYHAATVSRADLINFYEKIKGLYQKLGEPQKLQALQMRIDKAHDTKSYLATIETNYTKLCDRFAAEPKIIGIMHQNLMDACRELGLNEKAAYYEARLNKYLSSESNA